MSIDNRRNDINSMEPTVPLATAVLILGGVFIGTILTLLTLQSWLPSLGQSLLGPTPQAYWDLARSAGITAYLLIWLSMAFGLIITNKVARIWPGGPMAFDVHQFTSLLGMAFALFHVLILLGDQFIKYTPLQLAIPFASANYQPFWVGLGQIAFYLMIPVTFTFYIRRHIGAELWRAIHGISFIMFSLLAVHGLLAGSDTTNPVVFAMYAFTCASIFFLTLYRMLTVIGVPA